MHALASRCAAEAAIMPSGTVRRRLRGVLIKGAARSTTSSSLVHVLYYDWRVQCISLDAKSIKIGHSRNMQQIY